MKVGDIVRFKKGGNGRDMLGTVLRLDIDFYGASQALKVYNAPRGVGLHSKMVNGIGPTERGINNRVLVMWCNHIGHEYCMEDEIEVVSEKG